MKSVCESLEARALMSGSPLSGHLARAAKYVSLVPDATAQAIVVQPDGKTVVAAGIPLPSDSAFVQANQEMLVRFLPDGKLDNTFGNAGVVEISPKAYMQLRAITLQPDGKIIVAGCGGDDESSTHFLTGRFNSDGTPDSGFGTGGFVSSAFAATDIAFNVSLQEDGKIVVSGKENWPNQGPAVVVRYTSSGQADAGFGTQGEVEIPSMSYVFGGTATESDGRIIVGGNVGGYLELLALTPSGAVDSGFGNAGFTSPLHALIGSIAIQADGKIVVGGSGSLGSAGEPESMLVGRFTPDGGVDTSFGNGGTTEVKFHIPARLEIADNAIGSEIAVEPNGKIVLGGGVRLSPYSDDPGETAVVRFNANGRLDRVFGDHGRFVNVNFTRRGPKAKTSLPFRQSAMALDANSRIVFGGMIFMPSTTSNPNVALGLTRITVNGGPDKHFGHSGLVGI